MKDFLEIQHSKVKEKVIQKDLFLPKKVKHITCTDLVAYLKSIINIFYSF